MKLLRVRGNVLWQGVLVLIGLLILGGVTVWANYDYPGNCNNPYDTVQLGPHTISFCGRTYDSVSDESTWYYFVTSGSSPSISHWVLGLCDQHVVLTADPNDYEVGDDRHNTNIHGIKFETGFQGGETRLCSVTLQGNWEVDYVEVGIKAGGDVYGRDPRIYILGPSCTPFVPPQITVTVSGLKDLTIDQPSIGQWSATGDFKILIGDPSDGTGLNVSVTANVSYSIYISYSYVISPAGSLPSPEEPLSYEYPSGTWYTIPKYLNMATLHGPYGSSGTASYSYPVAVDLTQLGDRTANDTITFTIHVMVTAQ